MSGSNPLSFKYDSSTADDPWSGFTPGSIHAERNTDQELQSHTTSFASHANGGANTSIHAPAHQKAEYHNPLLSERLPRVDSIFGSKNVATSSRLADTENLDLAWNINFPEMADLKKQQQQQDSVNPFQQCPPMAPKSSPVEDPLSANGVPTSHNPNGSAAQIFDQIPVHTQEQDKLGQENQSNVDDNDDDQDLDDQADEDQEHDDDDDDGEEAFVYPGPSNSDHEQDERQNGDNDSPSSQERLSVQESPYQMPFTSQPVNPPSQSLRSTNTPSLDLFAPLPQRAPTPKPVDYEKLASLCSKGPLNQLQSFFAEACSEASGVSPFTLANEPNPSNGLVPLHFAAKEGKTEIVKWLVQEAGAIIEMEDREGETPLHKAAMNGRLSVLTFLLSAGADADAKDADGWTALHNACSRGYLDIVRVLVETAKADIETQGGRGRWTPLMNAASKGHLPIVRQLTSKYHADPFVRNAAGETAFDIAAATFEIYIFEVLEKYEAERWNASKYSTTDESTHQTGQIVPGRGPYNPLALHTTVPVILHENQRLDTRLQTLAINSGRPRWSSSSAARPHKPDRRAPSSMPPGPLAPSRTRHSAMTKQGAHLPNRAMPYKLRLKTRMAAGSTRRRAGPSGSRPQQIIRPAGATEEDLACTPTPESVLYARRASEELQNNKNQDKQESSHFWLSEWQCDFTHPLVDVEQGWQYAQSFDALDDKWSAEIPPPLSRLLEGRGLSASVTHAITGSATTTFAQGDQEAAQTGWVRRRRWVRVMRRRLDIEFGDDLEASEFVPSNQADGTDDADKTCRVGKDESTLSTAAMMSAQEAARTECAQLGPEADYVQRSKALAGSSAASGSTPADALGQDKDELARRIARLIMAITELRLAFSDGNAERRSRAEELRKEYTVQLGQLREAAGLEEGEDEASDLDEEEFIYPNSYKDDGASMFTRLPAVISESAMPGSSTGAVSRPIIPRRRSSARNGGVAPSEAGTAMVATRSADLAANRDFRVPTNETPNKVSFGRTPVLREQHVQPQWERDDEVSECSGCGRRFTFFLRKHHCRRCGRIFCDPCSSKRAQLGIQELVVDPSLPDMAILEAGGPSRICNNCHAEQQLPASLQNIRGADALMRQRPSISSSTGDVGSVAPSSDVSSRASELNECPVCNKTLAAFGGTEAQEAHVRDCLENGGGGSLQGGRYLVYKLPGSSPIVGKECLICMEDFVANNMIARLPCLCYFHRGCIDSWFKRGRECPVHARSW